MFVSPVFRDSAHLLYETSQRTTAKKGTQSRCKVSVIAEASAKLQNSVPPASLRPYEEHFHPLRNLTIVQQNRPESRRVGHPYVSVNVLPYEEQVGYYGIISLGNS